MFFEGWEWMVCQSAISIITQKDGLLRSREDKEWLMKKGQEDQESGREAGTKAGRTSDRNCETTIKTYILLH